MFVQKCTCDLVDEVERVVLELLVLVDVVRQDRISVGEWPLHQRTNTPFSNYKTPSGGDGGWRVVGWVPHQVGQEARGDV
jgi:hypothetical protein